MKQIVWGAGIVGILLLLVGSLSVFGNRPLPDNHGSISPVVESVRNIFPTSLPTAMPVSAATVESISIAQSVPSRGRFPDEWSIIATGDIIPARSVNAQTVARNDFTWSWKHIAPLTSQADITLINLESPLLANCPVTQEGMVFCGDARHVDGLVFAGVDIANLANNHSANYGQKGIEETVANLSSHSIQTIGMGNAAVRTINTTRVAFLGFNDIYGSTPPISWAENANMKNQIQQVKQNADIVVVSLHFGEEYTATTSARQVELAHAAVDVGADLVIGNHPHWIQPVEVYKGKWISYAHGNTIFDQMWSKETTRGVLGVYTFSGKTLADVTFIPTQIASYGQPFVITDAYLKEAVRASLLGGK